MVKAVKTGEFSAGEREGGEGLRLSSLSLIVFHSILFVFNAGDDDDDGPCNAILA